ncbi:MAG: D-alanyl-D-alanine dipeptidase [Cyanobium sp. RS427]|nr:D-alanyl-D-alanine dipeptidase [Cyanobium sp. RS427]
MRPWSDRPIHENGEALVALPPALLRLEPHPYVAAGAPYGPGADPFQLRSGVVERLLTAQQQLQARQPELRLAIFDAWRPLAVQAYMVEQAVEAEINRRGIDRTDPLQLAAVRDTVGRFWASPSPDPATPPPHSTGAAVDLTLARQSDGTTLAMGGAIDAVDVISEPNHYAGAAPNTDAAQWHQRRQLLASVMEAADFAQHPNEWWHFSHGDQLWAWRTDAGSAVYAAAPSSSLTA